MKRSRSDSYTPYPLKPFDSPSNPFKKRRINVDSLPAVSSFRKHIPLRFQFCRGGGGSKGYCSVHRIVQVPLNYSFTHLRALIAWLFDVPPKSANGKAADEDYMFEVKTGVTMDSPRRNPGIIKRGETSVRVSNSRDPWRTRRSPRDPDDHDELDGDEFGDNLDSESSNDCLWADEEDYTLAHVWVTGLRADRGVIYHHSPSSQVHITVNTTKLPRRRGRSNVPYVFSATGRVHLAQRPLPRPLFTQSILHTLSSSPARPSIRSLQTTVMDSGSDQKSARRLFLDNNKNNSQLRFERGLCRITQNTRKIFPEIVLVEDSDDNDEEDSSSSDDDDEDYECVIDPEQHWNKSHYAFGRYLCAFLDPRGRSYAHLEDEYFEEKKLYDPFENDDDDEEDIKEETSVEDGTILAPDSCGSNGSSSSSSSDGGGGGGGGGVRRSSTPGLTSSSGRSSSLLPPSSPPTQTTSPPVAIANAEDNDDDDNRSGASGGGPLSWKFNLDRHPSIIASHYPNKKYTFTPAPPVARRHRLQLDMLERRLERGKKGSYLCEYDEEDEEEKDELDDDHEEEVVCVRPVLKEGEVWDPFGDEAEV